ncbi:MAG: segregation/condensation protein A, partial [Anaerolineales bacterium]
MPARFRGMEASPRRMEESPQRTEESLQGVEEVRDRHVERLLEGVAFLTAQIRQKLSLNGSATFSDLLGEDYTRVEIVVTFLALLELVRRFRITAVQDDIFQDIRIVPTEDWDEDEEIDIDMEE